MHDLYQIMPKPVISNLRTLDSYPESSLFRTFSISSFHAMGKAFTVPSPSGLNRVTYTISVMRRLYLPFPLIYSLARLVISNVCFVATRTVRAKYWRGVLSIFGVVSDDSSGSDRTCSRLQNLSSSSRSKI